MKRLAPSAYRKLRWQVYERDGGECVICHRPACDVHHVIFRSAGGADSLDNCVSLCRECHERYAHGSAEKHWQEEFIKYLEGR